MPVDPIQPVVIAFPGLASWVIVGLGGVLVVLATLGGRLLLSRLEKQDNELLKRLDAQDAELTEIRTLIASEMKMLRERQHGIEVRVTRIESTCSLIHWREHNKPIGGPVGEL